MKWLLGPAFALRATVYRLDSDPPSPRLRRDRPATLRLTGALGTSALNLTMCYRTLFYREMRSVVNALVATVSHQLLSVSPQHSPQATHALQDRWPRRRAPRRSARAVPGGLNGCRCVLSNGMACSTRSEERRVGKECRSRWSPYD